MALQSEMERVYVAPSRLSPIEAETLADSDKAVLSLAVLVTITTDSLAIVAGGVGSLLTWRVCGLSGDPSCTSQLISFSVLYGIGFALLGTSESLYRNTHSLLRVLESAAVLRVSVFSLVLAYLSIWVTMHAQGSPLLLCSWLLATLIILLLRQVARPLIFRYSGSRGKQATGADRGVGIGGSQNIFVSPLLSGSGTSSNRFCR